MSNPWVSFAKLLQGKPRWIGQVVSYNNGKAIVIVPVGLGGGGDEIVVCATSEYVVGDYVFIEDGVIVSKAPPLRSASNETVY